ncbi:MAG: NADAR family protein [Prevotellaceae bacterium]|nr:NADAR family protein [Candidatus Faecinaster equi]
MNGFDKEYAFLSNFYDCNIVYLNSEYANAESAFQAMKCENPLDRKPFQYDCPPNIAKRLGRTVRLRPDWEQCKFDIMKEIVTAKFTQHPELMQKLQDTGDAILIEGNYWHDCYWGACNCAKCAGKNKYNKLGIILMEIRDTYKNTAKEK